MKNVFVFLYLFIDYDVYCVMVDGIEVSLMLKEYEFLYFLVKIFDKVYDWEKFLKEVW